MASEVEELTSRGREGVAKFREVCETLRSTALKLRKLEELDSREEVPKPVSESLRREYTAQLLSTVEEYFKQRLKLEDLRVGILAEVERIRLELEASPDTGAYELQPRLRNLRRRQEELNRTIEEIDKALTEDLDVDTKIFVAVRYLESARERNRNLNNEEVRSMRSFVNSIAEGWMKRKDQLTRRLSDLQREASDVEEKLREVWARFMVGEYDHNYYMKQKLNLEKKLAELEDQINTLRSTIEETDVRMIELNSMLEEWEK